MKIGVFSVILNDLRLDDALDYIAGLGIEAVEIGTAGYSKSSHCAMDALLGSQLELERYIDKFKRRNLVISALSAHGNPVHPDREYAQQHHREFEKAVVLAEKLGLDTVLLMSGCPGGSPEDRTPNWVTCTWPTDFSSILDYQWQEVLIPYWQKAADFSRNYGVTKLAIEPHPGFCVYNTETLLKLRAAVGEEIGINFDPSHLFWQGIDPAKSVLALQKAVFHVHAKDTCINQDAVRLNGVLDTKPYSMIMERSWYFRTVGYGHSEIVWKEIVSALAAVKYDGVLSIEHEDCLMSREEGLRKAVEMLQSVIIRDVVKKMWWETRAEG
jgi:sugar phosphate isomerase/epimerase